MLPSDDLERLIKEKRREIEKEKTVLGLSPSRPDDTHVEELENKENEVKPPTKRSVSFTEGVNSERVLGDHDENKGEEFSIPPELERYIRRYLGLPVMLKAGEYSPNNPLLRAERTSGDALLGIGEYERRKNTLRKIRQQQYREYLDQQAKKKQEAKEQAERERREREEKERQREEERERLRRELEEKSTEQRRASVCYGSDKQEAPAEKKEGSRCTQRNKVDAGVQVGINKPLSVAVQTDEADLYRLSPPLKCRLTQAERELSPHTVVDDERPIQPAAHRWEGERRRSYGDFDECPVKRSNREKLVSDLRHTYMPSIFDEDAIQMRNAQAQKEAAERRQFYQQELKNQILEQQRIREERKTREKMLEQAEMRRLEEQLRMLRAAQEKEVGKQRQITSKIKQSASDFEIKRTTLQKEIDDEHKKLLRASTQPKRFTTTSHSDSTLSKLPFYYPRDSEKLPYSTNIPENSIFNPSYDVESYLRKNLNPSKESLLSERLVDNVDLKPVNSKNVIVEKALIHDRPKEKVVKSTYEPSLLKKKEEVNLDEVPIPVLRHSPQNGVSCEENLSEAMRKVDDKWKVPVVQKNILKSCSEDGKSVSILTQLGSIRRQLQLEQLKLDNMCNKHKGDGDK